MASASGRVASGDIVRGAALVLMALAQQLMLAEALVANRFEIHIWLLRFELPQ